MHKNKINIAFFLPSLSNTGPVIATRDIIKGISNFANCEIFYFDETIDPICMNVKCNKINFLTKIDISKFDILHSHMFRPDLYIFLHYLFYLKKRNCKFVSSNHGEIREDLRFLYGNFISILFSPIWRFILSKFNCVIVASEELAKKNKLNNYEVIGYFRDISSEFSIPNEDVLLIENFKKNRIIIGYVASLINRKNHTQIIKYLATKDNVGAIFLGNGPEYENLIELAIKLNISEKILFLGFRTDSRPYYKYFDIYCSSSRSEGFSLALIDAMSNKIPIVLSNIDVYQNLKKSIEVVFFNLDDVKSLAESIDFALLNKNALIENSYNKYVSNFSFNSVSLLYNKFYSKILNNVIN